MDNDKERIALGFGIAFTSIISTLIFIYDSGVSAGIFGTIMAILAFLLICVNNAY